MASRDDYIPSKDVEFRAWMGNFLTKLSTYMEDLDVTPEQYAEVSGNAEAFAEAITEHTSAQAKARAATACKRVTRSTLSDGLRTLVRRINTHENMTNSIRNTLGLNEWSDTRTRHGVGPEVPGIALEAINGGVIVHFGTNPSNEWLNGKPKWARGCNIYRRKEGEENYRLVAFCETSPFMDQIREQAVSVTYVVQYRGRTYRDVGNESSKTSIAAGGEDLKKRA